MVTLTQGQVLGALGNVACGLGFFAASTLVAFTVNRVTHQNFNLQKDTTASYLATICSFTAVLVLSMHLAPYAIVAAFTGRQVVEMAVISYLAACFFKTEGVFELLAGGAFMGWIGHNFSTCLGAGFGTIAGYEAAHRASDGT